MSDPAAATATTETGATTEVTSAAETTSSETTQTEAQFTQADVDRIVADRLARERGKYADYDDLKTKATAAEEQAAQVREEAKTAAEKAFAVLKRGIQLTHGISDEDAAEFLTATDEEGLTRQAERLAGIAGSGITNGNRVPDEGREQLTGKSSPAEQLLAVIEQQLS